MGGESCETVLGEYMGLILRCKMNKHINYTSSLSGDSKNHQSLDRCAADSKRLQVPAQTIIPSKNFIQHIDGENKIFHDKVKFKNTYLQIQSNMKENSNLRRLTTPMKTENLTPAKPKDRKHIHTCTNNSNNKITGIINHWSLISFSINGLNLPNKKTE